MQNIELKIGNEKELFSKWKKVYLKTLLENVMPFWMNNCIDEASGAINNCVNDEGIVTSKNRFIWSQGRALWTFSALYNKIEKREEWLKVAKGLFEYLVSNGRDEEGKWMFLLSEDGSIIEDDTSICVDGFVMSGMCEYYKATNSSLAAKIALETFENTYNRLNNHGSYRIAPYVLPKNLKIHGINMMFSSIYFELGKTLDRPDICEVGYNLAIEILEDFYDSENGAILEFVSINGDKIDSPKGRVCVPGHVLESMWFLIDIFIQTGDNNHIMKCCDIIMKHIKFGWDEDFGGIQLAIDIKGKEPVAWDKNTCKPWWVQVEALVATIYAYKFTGDKDFIKWHEKIHEYAFKNYPTQYGEWTQWLDRYGNKTETAALPVKDPYHLPRGLMYLINQL